MCTDVPAFQDHFPEDSANIDSFKFVKLPTIFPLPYRTTAIKGSLSDDSVGANLTKVDTTININTTVLPQTGLLVCSNIFLLCCTFAQSLFHSGGIA